MSKAGFKPKKKKKVSRTCERARWRISESVWRALDWNRTAAAIAEELRCTVQAVYQAAERYGYTSQLLDGHKAQVAKADWKNLPITQWEKVNSDLAEEYQCSRQLVSKNRKRYAPDHLKTAPRK